MRAALRAAAALSRRGTGALDAAGECSTSAAAGAHVAAGQWRSTTVLCVRKGDQVVMVADGQVTAGSKVLKPNVKKLRRLGVGDGVVGGFAGSTADALTLFERLESQLEAHPGQLRRAAVELAKEWRQDKVLRRLEARMIVADAEATLEISGDGEVLEPHDGVLAIGSGAGFAVAAARALLDLEGLDAVFIADKAMRIAAASDIYTNDHFTRECLRAAPAPAAAAAAHARILPAEPPQL